MERYGKLSKNYPTVFFFAFIRRFLLHVLHSGFHRIRYYGLLANSGRKDNLVHARERLIGEKAEDTTDAVTNSAESGAGGPDEQTHATYVCPDCGAPMRIIDTFLRGQLPRAPPRRME